MATGKEDGGGQLVRGKVGGHRKAALPVLFKYIHKLKGEALVKWVGI